MRGLLWFTDDLRLRDNAALNMAAQECSTLLCVYCVNPADTVKNRYDCANLGPHRQRFLWDSLKALRDNLASSGQYLLIVEGRPSQQVAALCQQFGIDQIYTANPLARDEQRELDLLRDVVGFDSVRTFTQCQLFDPELHQKTFKNGNFPRSFTQFRKRLGSLEIPAPAPMPVHLPPPLLGNWLAPDPLARRQSRQYRHPPRFRGGENAAWDHLENYFSSKAPASYKQTRNALEGEHYSSHLSPWLAMGCISVRDAVARLKQFERHHGPNDSTEHLLMELLWREFFHAYSRHYGARLFLFGGIQGRTPLTSFYAQRFKMWCSGNTPWPLVNAAMHELAATGYISNRARQIVASCLVNELQCDWRAGAWWFQHQLVDHDVASNWGNWQYIAGVGADPRGGRHFDLEKQTKMFDPDGVYIDRWNGYQGKQKLYSVDAADWPIS